VSGQPVSRGGARVSGAIRVRDVVRDVVVLVAPEELPLVDGLSQSDDATVIQRLTGRVRRREPLGFGLGEIVALVTPVVWVVLNEAAQRAAGAAVDGTAKGAKRLLRKVFRRRSAPVTVPGLTPDQIAELRARLLAAAAEQGLDGDLAQEIADTVIKRLERGDEDPPTDRDASGGREA
jgi:hypothetical protein